VKLFRIIISYSCIWWKCIWYGTST